MRILFLTQFFQPEPVFKGLPFARALRDRGHSVEVLTGFPNYPGGKLYPGYTLRFCQREVMDGIPVLRLPLYPSHDGSAVRRAANYLSFAGAASVLGPAMVQKPDVIYVYNLVTLALAWQLMRLWHGCAVVLDVQDLWPESVLSSGMLRAGFWRRRLEGWCRRAYQSADRIVAQSPGFKRHLEQAGVPGNRIEVIYNWTEETPLPTPDAVRDARRMYRMENRFNVLFAGSMGGVQALDSILNAARKILVVDPSVLFTFVGAGTEVARLKSTASDLPNVQFVTRVSAVEAMRLSQAADALLVHLRSDPLFTITIPSKTQSYLYAGRPILMGVRGDAADLVRDANAGVCFEPESTASIVDAIMRLVRLDGGERERMGRSGRLFYDQKLAFHNGVMRFERLMTGLSINRDDGMNRAKSGLKPSSLT